MYRLTWRLLLADLVAFSHLQVSQIRGRQPYLIVRNILYVISINPITNVAKQENRMISSRVFVMIAPALYHRKATAVPWQNGGDLSAHFRNAPVNIASTRNLSW